MSPVADKSPLVNLMPTLLPATTPLAVAVTVIVVPVWEYVPARAGSVWTLPFSDKSASRLPPAPKPKVTFKLPLLRFLPAFMPRPVFALPRLNSRQDAPNAVMLDVRSEEHTSELQSLMRISYAVFCLKKKNNKKRID